MNDILTASLNVTFASIMACIMVLVHNDSSSKLQTQDEITVYIMFPLHAEKLLPNAEL